MVSYIMSIHIAAKQGVKLLINSSSWGSIFVRSLSLRIFLKTLYASMRVRNMFGYTGTYKGHRVSVMGTGMGIPSISIYARELIVDYGVKKLIRVRYCWFFE